MVRIAIYKIYKYSFFFAFSLMCFHTVCLISFVSRNGSLFFVLQTKCIYTFINGIYTKEFYSLIISKILLPTFEKQMSIFINLINLPKSKKLFKLIIWTTNLSLRGIFQDKTFHLALLNYDFYLKKSLRKDTFSPSKINLNSF